MDEILIISNNQKAFDNIFLLEIALRVQQMKGNVYYKLPQVQANTPEQNLERGVSSPEEIIVSLGSAGIFSAVYQAIASYLSRNQNRELTLSKGKITITLKGHSLIEEKELLKSLAPELLPNIKNENIQKVRKK